MQRDSPAVRENQNLTDAAIALLLARNELAPGVSSDDSGKVVGTLSPIAIARKTLGASESSGLTSGRRETVRAGQ